MRFEVYLESLISISVYDLDVFFNAFIQNFYLNILRYKKYKECILIVIQFRYFMINIKF